MASKRIVKIKKAILGRPFLFSFSFLIFLFLNIFFNELYVTHRALTNNLVYGVPFVIFGLVIPFFVALNVVLIFNKVKELREMNPSAGGVTSAGVFLGILGGACPGCFAGVFPAVLGIFGSSLTLSSLPFFGIEIQLLSLILLILSVFILTKDNVCKVGFKK